MVRRVQEPRGLTGTRQTRELGGVGGTKGTKWDCFSKIQSEIKAS